MLLSPWTVYSNGHPDWEFYDRLPRPATDNRDKLCESKNMPQTITLILPDNVLQPAQRVAQATKQSLEDLLVAALQAALPTLEGLPHDIMQHLIALESLDDQALWRVMLETVPLEQQNRIHDLLSRNQAGMITDSEGEQLAILQREADLVMLRKARAAVLLRFRGKRVPTLAELSQIAATHQ
jgi:hypothetical protein